MHLHDCIHMNGLTNLNECTVLTFIFQTTIMLALETTMQSHADPSLIKSFKTLLSRLHKTPEETGALFHICLTIHNV